MPIGFLTAADRAPLNRFPDQIPHEDLSAFFLFSEADQRAINQHREAHTRLGCALPLCALRYLGFAPDDLQTAPAAAVEYVAQQLGVAPQALAAYGARRPTRTPPLQQVQAHLHFRLATPLDFYAIQTWLVWHRNPVGSPGGSADGPAPVGEGGSAWAGARRRRRGPGVPPPVAAPHTRPPQPAPSGDHRAQSLNTAAHRVGGHNLSGYGPRGAD